MNKYISTIRSLQIGDCVQTLCNGVPEGRVFVVKDIFSESIILYNVKTKESETWSFKELFDNEVEFFDPKTIEHDHKNLNDGDLCDICDIRVDYFNYMV